MTQPLPMGDFEWEDPNNYDWRHSPENRGYIIECDINYTSNAKFQTSKFPLAPEKLIIKEEELSSYKLRCLEIEGKMWENSKINIKLKI